MKSTKKFRIVGHVLVDGHRVSFGICVNISPSKQSWATLKQPYVASLALLLLPPPQL